MSQLNNIIKNMIEKANDDDNDDVRFSLTFQNFDNRRIEYVRRSLKQTKQDMLTRIIMAAIADIEVELGLAKNIGDAGSRLNTEYVDKLMSDKPIAHFFKQSK